MADVLTRILLAGFVTYEELYTSVPDENLHEVGSKVNHLVRERCSAGNCTSSQCHSVFAAVVEKAVGSLVPNKNDEIYNISSNHFINGTKLLFLQLSNYNINVTIWQHRGIL